MFPEGLYHDLNILVFFIDRRVKNYVHDLNFGPDIGTFHRRLQDIFNRNAEFLPVFQPEKALLNWV